MIENDNTISKLILIQSKGNNFNHQLYEYIRDVKKVELISLTFPNSAYTIREGANTIEFKTSNADKSKEFPVTVTLPEGNYDPGSLETRLTTLLNAAVRDQTLPYHEHHKYFVKINYATFKIEIYKSEFSTETTDFIEITGGTMLEKLGFTTLNKRIGLYNQKKAVDNLVGNGTKVVVTLPTAHSLQTGDSIQLNKVKGSIINGAYTVEVIDHKNFAFPSAETTFDFSVAEVTLGTNNKLVGDFYFNLLGTTAFDLIIPELGGDIKDDKGREIFARIHTDSPAGSLVQYEMNNNHVQFCKSYDSRFLAGIHCLTVRIETSEGEVVDIPKNLSVDLILKVYSASTLSN